MSLLDRNIQYTIANMHKRKLLNECYKILNLDFSIDHTKHIYLYNFYKGLFYNYPHTLDMNSFNNNDDYKQYRDKCGFYVKQSGSRTYCYHGLFEALLWYNYYKYQKRHTMNYRYDLVTKTNKDVSLKTTSYFGVIPKHYRGLDSKEGLKIIKKIIDEILIDSNGIPDYFDPELLKTLFMVK
jgi:hypothetical protein